jgi:NADPH-dependent 2,4-dienoyl-CoA reductase/sulfur reductase-like enzyme
VAILDDNPAPGGQIWRGEAAHPTSREAGFWLRQAARAEIAFLHGARVFAQPRPGELWAESDEGTMAFRYDRLILTPGARERFLPFPGWTLPNVTGAGGLQALVKTGLPIEGKAVVVAGSGPLLLAVAAYLRKRGAVVHSIAEQASWRRLVVFSLGLLRDPGKLVQALGLKFRLRGVPYRAGCWPVAAKGDGKLGAVTLTDGRSRWDEPCDYLACGFGLVPNVELPQLLGCAVRDGRVRVDTWQQTTIAGIYCAGEATGIGGLERSLIEGRIAGYAAAGRTDRGRRLFAARDRAHRFARSLEQAFALRDELRHLPSPETVVCRCEDVPLSRLRPHGGWREAKLQTRLGMGPCQGRICGPAVAFLRGWQPESTRPPVLPVRVNSLLGPERPNSSEQQVSE